MFTLERINDQQYAINKNGTKVATISEEVVYEIKKVDELADYIVRAMAREMTMTSEEADSLIKALKEEEC